MWWWRWWRWWRRVYKTFLWHSIVVFIEKTTGRDGVMVIYFTIVCAMGWGITKSICTALNIWIILSWAASYLTTPCDAYYIHMNISVASQVNNMWLLPIRNKKNEPGMVFRSWLLLRVLRNSLWRMYTWGSRLCFAYICYIYTLYSLEGTMFV